MPVTSALISRVAHPSSALCAALLLPSIAFAQAAVEPGAPPVVPSASPAVPAPAAAAPANDEDVVESIEAPAAGETEAASKAALAPTANPGEVSEAVASAPRESESLQSEKVSYFATAWVAQELHLGLASSSPVPAYIAAPYDRFISRTRMFARFRYARGSWFEADASAAVSYDYFVEDHGHALGDNRLYSTRASAEPLLGELYLAFFTHAVDIRLGQQRLAWGRADTQSPNDVLNARDLRNPLSSDLDVTQIPTPLARVDWAFPNGTLQGVLAPLFTPDRFDVYGSNWALIQPGAPEGMRGFFHMMSTMVDPTQFNQFNRLVQQSRLPSASAKNMSAGAKLALTLGDVDFDAYYHFGFDRTPRLRIAPPFQDALNSADFSRATPADFGGVFTAIQTGAPPLTLEYVRRQHVGFDAGTVSGPIGLRIDAGYDTRRVVFRQDLLGVETRALQGIFSLEYQTGDPRKVLLFEGSLLHLFDVAGTPLLFFNATTLSGTALLRYPFLTSFDAELRAFVVAAPRSAILRPQISWRATNNASIAIGGVWLAGSTNGYAGYFDRNLEVYASARYTF